MTGSLATIDRDRLRALIDRERARTGPISPLRGTHSRPQAITCSAVFAAAADELLG